MLRLATAGLIVASAFAYFQNPELQGSLEGVGGAAVIGAITTAGAAIYAFGGSCIGAIMATAGGGSSKDKESMGLCVLTAIAGAAVGVWMGHDFKKEEIIDWVESKAAPTQQVENAASAEVEESNQHFYTAPLDLSLEEIARIESARTRAA